MKTDGLSNSGVKNNMEKEELNLVICPMADEIEQLLKKAGDYKRASYGIIEGYEFRIEDEKYFAYIGKIGKANIAFGIGYLSALVAIKEIFLVGVAGSLKDDIVPLNVVVADKVCYYDVDVTGGGDYKIGQMAGEELYFQTDEKMLGFLDELNSTLTIRVGTIISGDSFATKKNMNDEFLKNFDDPLATDMESAAVGQMAHRINVPFFIIRGISDNALKDGSGEVYNEMVSMAARRAASVFFHLVKKDFAPDQD